MSTATDLIHDLITRGAELSMEDGKLKVRAEEDVLTPEMLGALRAHKEEILRLLPEHRDSAPLSVDQEGLWFIQDSAPDSTAYNVPICLRIESEEDHRPALRRALQKLVDRHALLRTTYPVVDGSPRQIVHAHRALDRILAEVSAEHLSLDEVLDEAAAIQHRPFDLATEGALRARLFRRGPGESVLLLCVHHIAVDGWSSYLLLDELVRLYEADGRANPLPLVKRTYQQFVTWQRDLLARRGEELRRAWLDELAGAPPALNLPTDRARPPIQTFRGATRRSSLAPALVDGLRALARSCGTTLSTILLTAYQILLHRYSDQEDLCVGFGVARRDREELTGSFGYMVNQLVIRSRLAAQDAPELRSLIQNTHERVLGAMSRQDYPFRWLVKDLLADRDPSRPPLVQAAFVYQRPPSLCDAAVALLGSASVQVRGDRWTGLSPSQDTSELDLILEVREWSAELELRLRYNSDLFDAGTIGRMARHLELLLAAAVADPDRSAAQLPMLTEDERRQLMELNRTDAPFSSEACIHELFEAHVDRTPDAPAIVDLCDPAAGPGGATVSYGELDRRANQIAHHLIRIGVGPEVRVGVCLPRGADLIACLLGVLKAGGAFAVLDPEHPRRHLAVLLEDTGVPVVLTHRALRAALPVTGARVIELDHGLGQEPVDRPARRAKATDLAYVLYTSGSTGRPNGVLIEHRGLVNSIEAQIRLMETGPGARHAHILSFNFDGALADLFDAICAGGAAYLVPRDGEVLGGGLVEVMAREAITHAMLVPSMLAALPDAELPALRTIVVAGERCPAELVARWGRGGRLLNMYGPTETSILATAARCVADGAPPPIGRPVPNMTAYVVDRAGQLAPVGVIGELWLGGVGVARGYLNRPELTAQKFIDNPFGEGRLYRTGDLVRLRAVEGRPPVLEFVGRADFQVKIRGYRIELGEVESALRASSGVRDAVAIVHEPGGTSPRLVAYVTPARSTPPKQWELDQIDTWSAVLGELDPEPGDDLSGWKSSYTGQDLPRTEMLAWVEQAVARIFDLVPRQVLEIGCGSGMLLTRIAPRVQRYHGTDLSRHAIDRVEALSARLPDLGNVTVSHQPAHDLTGLTGQRFDTVILNSVVQYFPSAGYLTGVIEGLLGLLAPGGAIFLGDVRNLALLETYHVSVQRVCAGGTPTRRELRDRVSRAMADENELVVHPRFFTELRATFPQIADVEITPKRGAYRNELSLFRYDVILRTSVEGSPAPPIEWRAPGAAAPTLDELRDWIVRAGPGRALGVRRIPNARLLEDNAWRRWLVDDGEGPLPPTAASDLDGLDPEALHALEAELPCRVRLSWAAADPDGCFDAIVATGGCPVPRVPPAPAPTSLHGETASDPLRGRRHRELATALGRELREALPPHLVPSAIVVLPALPLTVNGKLDVRALPPPERARASEDEPAEPRTESERKLAEIWCNVLGLPRIGIHDNFFELGGDSILSIQLVSQAQELGLALRTAQIFEHQTIARLAAVAGTRAIPAEQGAVSGPVPLTAIQHWFFAQDRPAPSHFNQAVLLETPPDLDPDLLRRALQHIVAHHDALRMRFVRRGQTWAQECLASLDEVALEVVERSSVPPEEQRAALDRIAARLAGSLDITAGPLMRAALFQLGPRGAARPGRLLWVIHHLVVDAVSWRVLIPDLSAAVRQLAAGRAARLPAKTTSFKRWAERVTEHARGAAFEEERAILELAPPAALPVDRPAGRNGRDVAAELRVALSPEETRGLIRDALAPYNLGVQDVLLTAFAQAVARWTGSPEVWIDLEGHGREELFDDVDLSRTVGWFTSLFPVRLRLPADDEPAATLVAVKEQLRAVPRRGIGYGLLRYLKGGGGALRWPQPQLAFNYLGHLGGEGGDAGDLRLVWENAGPLDAPAGTRSHVLDVNAVVAGDHLEVVFGYSRELHEVATVERLAGDFLAALGRLIRHCTSPGVGGFSPSDFPFAGLGPEELRVLLARVGETGRSKVEAIYPLTSFQREILFHTLHSGLPSMYRVQLVLTFEGELDSAALRSAWEQVVRRHPLLRSAVFWDDLAAPVQVVLRDAVVPWEERDWREVPDAPARLTALARELVARGLPLDAAPVMRLTLIRTADQRYTLFYDCHHVSSDGWSGGVTMRDLLEAYQVAKGQPLGASGAGARAPGSYDAYLRFLESQDLERSSAFWRRTLDGLEAPTPLVMARSLPDGEHEHRSYGMRLDAELTTRLQAAADAERVTPHTLLDGAWALLLGHYSGRRDVVFGTAVSGREASVPGIEDMVGLFINALPARARIDEARDVWAWLRALQADQAAAREHHYLSEGEIRRCTALPVETPLFSTIVVYENYPIDLEVFHSAGLTVKMGFEAGNLTHYALTVVAMPGPALEIVINYDRARFAPESIRRLGDQLVRLLRAMIDTPAPRLGALLALLDDNLIELGAGYSGTDRSLT